MSASSLHPLTSMAAEYTLPATPLAIRTISLSKRLDDRVVLHDLNLSIPSGEFVSLLGANGAGKSTLLKILATLTPSSSGELELFAHPLKRHDAMLRRRIGLIGHQSMLYRDLTARENLEFFGKLYNIPDAIGRADQLLDAVGLWDRAEDLVKTFSRGMTQRLAIARALVHDPDLLLADEPFDGLDAPSVRTVEQFLIDLHQTGKTVLLVNHDIPQSLRLAPRVILLHQGQAILDQSTTGLDAADVIERMCGE